MRMRERGKGEVNLVWGVHQLETTTRQPPRYVNRPLSAGRHRIGSRLLPGVQVSG